MKKLLIVLGVFTLGTAAILVVKNLKKPFDLSHVDTSGGTHE